MKTYPVPIAALLLSTTLSLVPSLATANQALAQKNNCMTCHAASSRVVGPSFKEIAVKYAGQGDAAAGVADRIVKGSTGRWGFVPMPSNPQVSADDAQALAAWILDQK